MPSAPALYVAARLAVAASLALAPRLAGRPWLGGGVWHRSTRDTVRLLAVRDAVIAGGMLATHRRSADLRPWLVACLVSDAADVVQTGAEAERSRRPGAAVACGLALLDGLAAAKLLRRAKGAAPPGA